MAKAAAASEQHDGPKTGSSVMSLVLGFAVVTGLAIGAGGMFGLQVGSSLTQPPAGAAKGDAKSGEDVKGRYAANATLHALPAIVTNLASPERTWIRLEASIVLEEQAAEAKALTAAITEDITSYLRTLSLPLIEGASGMLHLREDLNDRVRIRSGGKVRDIIVHTLIVE